MSKLWSLLLVMLVVSLAHADTNRRTEKPAVKSGYAPVNGLKLYYEVRGTGDPVIVLHGGIGATEMFGPNLDALAAHCTVIAFDIHRTVGPPISIGRSRSTRWRTTSSR